MKKYVSDYLNKGIKGHFNYEFVDVIVNDDNLLFIDPILIETSGDQWSKDAKEKAKIKMINTSKISFVFCGSFESMMVKKNMNIISHL